MNDEKALEMYNEGMDDTTLARALGVTHVTVYRWRKDRNLTSNKKRISESEKKKHRDSLALYLHSIGYADPYISFVTGMSPGGVAHFRQKRGLKPNFCLRRREDPFLQGRDESRQLPLTSLVFSAS